MDITKQLEELDLSTLEATLYIALLQLGHSQAGKISKQIKINRTTTYQILEKLIQKGLVSFIKKGNVRVYQATSPKRLVSLQKEKTRLAEDLVPALQQLSSVTQEDVSIYKGRKGIRTIMHQILECKEYVSFGSAGQFLEVMGHDFILYQKEKRKRKIKSRVILGKSSKKQKIVTGAYAQFRFVEDTYMNPTTTWVYKNKIAIIIWSKVPVATLIQSREVAKSYRSYFELLWKSAKK